MVSAILSRILILSCGTLYPAYASYKAIRTKNVKEYVKWMMYWVVFAIFCCIETFSDVFLSWLPFYYEIKIIFVIWMLSPVTRGSSFLYKKFVHPQLNKRERDIDEYISQVSKKGYSTLLDLGTRGLSYATHVMVRTAVKGQTTLAHHIQKSYSTNDLRVPSDHAINNDNFMYADEDEDELDNRLYEDNRELELRRDHRKLTRSSSDVSDKRMYRGQVKSVDEGLSSLQEEEEEEVSYSEETIYLQQNVRRHPTKESKMDPYGTMPRTRLRNRTKLPKS